jgi:phosphoglycolate phosphatase
MPRPVVIFDLDGTLVDSTKQIFNAMAHARQALGLPQVSLDFIKLNLGLPIGGLIPEKNLRQNDYQRLIETFRSKLLKLIQEENSLYPGVLELLELISEKGLDICVATSKPQLLAEAVVLNSELNGKIAYTQGTDGFPPKPNPEVISRCLGKIGTSRGVMIGDRAEDMQAAKSANIKAVGVTHTAHTSKQLYAAGADYVADNFINSKLLLGKIEELISQPH